MGNLFLNPALVASGAALVASPIIIHLINRLRYRRVRFAAMEFLLASQQKNRRRILIEQLLLLFLRILIVAAIVLLVARLILDPSQLSILKGSAQSHHLVVLDDSGSMRVRWGETSGFDEAVKVVKKLAARGADQPGTQKMTLLLLSRPDSAVFRDEPLDDDFVKRLESILENVRCKHQRLELTPALEAARESLEKDVAAVKYVHVVSDFRADDWQSQPAVVDAVKSLDKSGTSVNFVRTVPQRTPNLAVTTLVGRFQTAAAGVPLRLKVGVTNFGESVARNVQLNVVQDGQPVLGNAVKFDKIEAGKEALADLDVTFSNSGRHRLRVSLPADSLTADNTRFLAIDVPEQNHVLLVDGDPTGDEARYVADALDPEITGIDAKVEGVDYLARAATADLARYQCIYLLNVSELPPLAVVRLEDYVRSGGGLAWYMGDAARAAFYNRSLYRKLEERDGKTVETARPFLFPVPLSNTPRPLERSRFVDPGPDLEFQPGHPIFGVFEGQDNPLIHLVRINRCLPVATLQPARPAEEGAEPGKPIPWERDDNLRKDGVATIGVLRDRQPVMFEHRLGKGTIVTTLTSAGPLWSDFVKRKVYPIYQVELQKHIARGDRGQDRLRIAGQPIEIDEDAAEFGPQIEIVAPDAGGETTTQVQAAIKSAATDDKKSSATSAGERYVETFHETDHPGVYTLKLNRHRPREGESETLEVRTYAYNFPQQESATALAPTEVIREELTGSEHFRVQEHGDEKWIEGRQAGQELRRWLLIGLVVLLICELLLACRLSYHSE